MEEQKSQSGNGGNISPTMDVLRRMVGSERDLVMNRVPAETKREFLAFASENFMGNYGMALKWLMDYYTGLLPPKDTVLTETLSDHEARLQKLESPVEPEGKPIKNLRGETIGWKPK